MKWPLNSVFQHWSTAEVSTEFTIASLLTDLVAHYLLAQLRSHFRMSVAFLRRLGSSPAPVLFSFTISSVEFWAYLAIPSLCLLIPQPSKISTFCLSSKWEHPVNGEKPSGFPTMFCFFVVMLKIEPRAFHMLNKCSTTEQHPQLYTWIL